MSYLAETSLLKIKKIDDKANEATFEIEPFSPGYGVTVANSLRRVLLSSLKGAAINQIKIEGVTHEFSTLPGIKEDLVEIILNLKQVRIKLQGDDPATLTLKAKGPQKVTAGDFANNALIEIINPDQHIATLDSKVKLDLEAIVVKGKGYLPTEARKDENLSLGTIAIDAIFTPMKKVSFVIENTRVGRMTDFDKVILSITTDGTITPETALIQATTILLEYFKEIRDKLAPAPTKITELKKPVKSVAKKTSKKKV